MSVRSLAFALTLAACTHPHGANAPGGVHTMPTPSIQVGACGEPTRDGVLSEHPKLEHADRDLDGDGRAELVVVDRAKCTGDANCYWNVFVSPRDPGDCAHYIGTFEGAALEPLATKGDDNMSDVRAYWKQRGGRMLLESYRYARGGYRVTDVIQCKRTGDDRLECTDSEP